MQDKYIRGYKSSLDKETLLFFNKKFSQSSLIMGTGYLFTIHISIFLSIYIYISWLNSNLLCLPILLFFLARQLRALENIIHFGSHYNFTKNKKINDYITDYLCSYVVMQSVDGYRNFHLKHHSRYGSSNDPCKIRFEKFLTHSNKNLESYVYFIVSTLPSYFIEYYKEIGMKKQNLIRFFVFNLVIFISNLYLFNLNFALEYLLLFNIAFFICLPIIRSIAEYAEHNYKKDNCLFQTTFNNLSILDFLIFHPVGDGYHVVHHLFPAIPWWKQREAHQYLVKHDKAYSQVVSRTKFQHKYTVM